jgi:environmental stress-induced protein Ves
VSFERIAWRELAPRPWKNGAGVTRDIAVHPPAGDANDDFDWRISVAEIARDAPFSAFPGIDRCIVLLDGAGMVLREAGGAWQRRLDASLQPFEFSGDAVLEAQLIDGTSHDLNVMTRRGRWRSEVHVAHREASIAAADGGLLLCCGGSWRIAAEPSLPPDEAWLWRSGLPALQLRAERPDSSLLVVRLLCHDRTR